MSSLNSYIILSIAEKAYELFKKSNFSTYTSFCKKLGVGIEASMLSSKEKIYICEIMDELNIIYGLNDKKIWPYLHVFFKLDVEEFAEYYKYIRLTEINNPIMFIGK
jgi:hypothetical protein